jgi:hypothetical protein
MTHCAFCDQPIKPGAYALCEKHMNQRRPLLHWLLKRWVIQAREPEDSEWGTIGMVLGPRSADDALRRARATMRDLRGNCMARALYWWDAPPEERDVAIYEDQFK